MPNRPPWLSDPVVVNVRWFDGYLETFYDVTDIRHSSDLLWLVRADKSNRHIPLRQVRWFSTSTESHEIRFPDGTQEAADPRTFSS